MREQGKQGPPPRRTVLRKGTPDNFTPRIAFDLPHEERLRDDGEEASERQGAGGAAPARGGQREECPEAGEEGDGGQRQVPQLVSCLRGHCPRVDGWVPSFYCPCSCSPQEPVQGHLLQEASPVNPSPPHSSPGSGALPLPSFMLVDVGVRPQQACPQGPKLRTEIPALPFPRRPVRAGQGLASKAWDGVWSFPLRSLTPRAQAGRAGPGAGGGPRRGGRGRRKDAPGWAKGQGAAVLVTPETRRSPCTTPAGRSWAGPPRWATSWARGPRGSPAA